MVKALDLAYVTYRVTDLQVAEKFLTDFGLVKTFGNENRLYMRAADGNQYAYIAEKGDSNKFINFALNVASYDDLLALVSAGQASAIEDIDAPGGGSRVILTSPDGYRINVVYGREKMQLPAVRKPFVHNYGTQKNRLNAAQRPPKGIVPVLRLGHFAFTVSDPVRTGEWLNTTLGIKPTDYLVLPNDEDFIVGIFMCCDQGETYVDHHTLFASKSHRTNVHHCSFEVQDVDAVMSGHDYLSKQGYELEVGVGRHMAGSQVFDYWIDPFGMRIEHYADGDIVNNQYECLKISGTPEGVTQWGPVPPDRFFE